MKGSNSIEIDGDGRPERLDVIAQIQRDYAVDPMTERRSEVTYCWFRTRLSLRTSDEHLLYADEWSTKYEDMAALLETHNATSPEDYFARFGNHSGYYTTGVFTVSANEVTIRRDAIELSLAAQGIKAGEPGAITHELATGGTLRLFEYRAEWREDVRVVAYVPSLHRVGRDSDRILTLTTPPSGSAGPDGASLRACEPSGR